MGICASIPKTDEKAPIAPSATLAPTSPKVKKADDKVSIFLFFCCLSFCPFSFFVLIFSDRADVFYVNLIENGSPFQTFCIKPK